MSKTSGGGYENKGAIKPHVKYLHRAYLGMSILQAYTGKGLGSFMMQIALDQAKANGYEQVELGVYSDNDRARHMYKRWVSRNME